MVRCRDLVVKAAAVIGLQAVCTYAAPSVNVALKASFNTAPYLVELLETAAEENATAYFPLLDRIAAGHFDQATTDRDLYDLFKKTLKDEGHIVDAETLSSFEFALSIHAAAPRIEAHYQFYNTSVEPTIPERADGDCGSWIYFNGKQYCTADLASSSGEPLSQDRVLNLPFDRILGETSTKTPSILYADITSPSFRYFHKTMSLTARSGKTSYRVRYKPSPETPGTPVPVSGYGVELALKRTDYIVIDDRQAESAETAANEASGAKLTDDEVTDLKPLSASELLRLDMRASSFIMDSADPFDTLVRLTQDFPKHSAAMSAHNVSEKFKEEHIANREVFLPAGYNIMFINGVQILAREFDAYSMLEHLRRERKLVNSARGIGLGSKDTVELLSHPSIAKAASDEQPQRYDWRDELEGGGIILWLNNIEQDKRYAEYASNIRALLQRTFPGQLPPVRKEIHNLIFPVDFAEFKDVEVVVENLQNFVKRKIPIQFGLVPQTDSAASAEQAKVVYYLLETYGLGAGLDYLEKLMSKQGRKLSGPVQSIFDEAIENRKLRKDRTAKSLQDVLKSEDLDARVVAAQSYLARLGTSKANPLLFVNGIPLKRNEEWLQEMSGRVTQDLRVVQQAVFEEVLSEDSYIPDLFLADSSPRRNPWIIPEDETSIRHFNLGAVSGLAEGAVGAIPSLHANKDTIESEMAHFVVVADFGSESSLRLLSEAIAFYREHDNVELFLVHSSAEPLSYPNYAVELYKTLGQDSEISLDKLEQLISTEQLTASFDDVAPAQQYWDSADAFLQAAGFQKGDKGVLVSGRVMGPIPSFDGFNKDDFETLLSYESKKRLAPAAAAVKSLDISDKANTPLSFAKLSNLIALSTKSDVPEGVLDSAPPARTSIFNSWVGLYTLIERGELDTASIQIVAAIDPATEVAQRWVPILKVLSELDGVHLRLYINPKERLDELPVKRFYRHVLQSKPTFDGNGALQGAIAHFGGLPADALLTMAMDVPPAWLVAPKDSIHDLDNIKLSSVKGKDIEATYELENILIEGHSRDATIGSAPRGAQLVLGTEKDKHFADTIVMANLGYFQFKATPGFYNLTLQKGRSEEIFNIDSAGTLGYSPQSGDETTEIALTSFRGATIYPRLSRRAGMEEEDVLESSKTAADHIADKTDAVLSKVGLGGVKSGDYLNKVQKFGSNLLSGSSGSSTDVQTLPHADINIFSVASGHLYERMLNIMMVSVVKHTSHTVKFWFIEQFLSPSFKAFLPILAEEYGFRYEMVTYKWPHWLRGQKEKQREIWGYKILFLDVLFPLDLDKVIFVDADQIVRTDMYELVQYDLQGAPYGFTPMCDSRTEMEGFRFWKQGYWKNFLRGLPYHISALYVVDLVRFRQMAAGDRLRGQYHQLSADPASLSNLDQDLPNHMQHVLPIHSLPQEWLWCETWCSDESLGVARTIDLCNNPQTKEPKLERARRQVPEWTIYDDEIAALAQKKVGGEGSSPIAGSAGDAGIQAEMQEADARAQREENEKKKKAHDELTAIVQEKLVAPPSTIQKRARVYGGTPTSADRLHKPFKCPGSATPSRASEKPARKRRKVNYSGADGDAEDGDKPYSNDDRLALATRDVNRFPVFKPKDKDNAMRQRFSVPFLNKDTGAYNACRPPPLLGLRQGAVFIAKPLHDPSGEFAIVLYDPTVEDKPVTGEDEPSKETKEEEKLDEPIMHKSLADILGLKKKVEERPRVPVVIDPRLTKVLRPHQVEGVKFLYRATTGMIDPKAQGCIMADEMGLGKTLQCIALMWTLLKQSPDAGKPTIQKAVIACPSSLVRNWANELVKWLGKDAITPFAIDGKATKDELIQQIRQWSIASGRAVTRPVLIVSYDTLRLYVNEFGGTQIGLLLCDEGHKLKNADSQTFTALNSLNVQKRVILSGTPIQNDLSEYFSLLNFANPDYLGTRNDFRKKFEIPILKGRDANGTDADQKKGNERLSELLTLVNKFIIRRTNDILSKYLPVKYEHVVFCNMAPFQKDLYNHFLQSPDIKSLLRGKGSQPLKAIGMLKKLCNHPDLLNLPDDLPGSEAIFPSDYVPKDARGRDRDIKSWYSGKMVVLDRMLARIRADTNDKIVLISNYTQTLDMFDKLCRARNYGSLRLDGTMNVSKRQKLVDKFNDPEGSEFVFLLSSKAGGCGLNLIGANRLVLFDPDWNPAADQQALARVWRDGQKKDCFVYRFIATGTIEEKIFQRQSHKQSLSSCVVDSAEDVERHFSLDSLRELFQYQPDTTSDTHDTFKCKRCKDGKQFVKAPAMLYGDTSSWNHFTNDGEKGAMGKIQDLLLRQETSEQDVSAVFQYISH